MRFFTKKRNAPRYEAGELFFCREAQGRQIADRISEMIKSPYEKEGGAVRFQCQGVEFSFAAFGIEDEGEARIYARQELSGVQGYLRNLKTAHGDVKRHLLYTIGQCGSVVRVHYSFSRKSERADREKILLAENRMNEILKELRGVRTKGGSALAGPDGRMILDDNGNSKVKNYLPLLEERSQEEGPEEKAFLKEALARRKKSVMQLRRRQIYTPLSLPVIETEREADRRAKHQICGRAAALLTVSLYSECLLGEGMTPSEAGAFVRDIAGRFRAEEFFSPSEKAYLRDGCPDYRTQIQFSWQYENLYVMEWALGLFERLDWPENICSVEECAAKIREFCSLEEFERSVSLRPERELLDAADLYYRLHWACRDAAANGYPLPEKVLPEAAAERRRGLFWAAGCRTAPGEDPEKTPGGTLEGDGWDQTDLTI